MDFLFFSFRCDIYAMSYFIFYVDISTPLCALWPSNPPLSVQFFLQYPQVYCSPRVYISERRHLSFCIRSAHRLIHDERGSPVAPHPSAAPRGVGVTALWRRSVSRNNGMIFRAWRPPHVARSSRGKEGQMRSSTSAVGPWEPPHTKGFPPRSSLEIHSSSVDVGGACRGRAAWAWGHKGKGRAGFVPSARRKFAPSPSHSD